MALSEAKKIGEAHAAVARGRGRGAAPEPMIQNGKGSQRPARSRCAWCAKPCAMVTREKSSSEMGKPRFRSTRTQTRAGDRSRRHHARSGRRRRGGLAAERRPADSRRRLLQRLPATSSLPATQGWALTGVRRAALGDGARRVRRSVRPLLQLALVLGTTVSIATRALRERSPALDMYASETEVSMKIAAIAVMRGSGCCPAPRPPKTWAVRSHRTPRPCRRALPCCKSTTPMTIRAGRKPERS